jgi:hypothetical protein
MWPPPIYSMPSPTKKLVKPTSLVISSIIFIILFHRILSGPFLAIKLKNFKFCKDKWIGLYKEDAIILLV